MHVHTGAQQADVSSAPERPSFDVVALAASAGGLEALTAVLRELPAHLPAAVLVLQHLGGHGSALVDILARRTELPVAWAADGMPLVPGQVLVCPPRRALEVHPDGTCALATGLRQAFDLPIDTFFESLADSYGERAVAVVLTGMGHDGAAGVRALDRAGATVIAQNEETAEQPGMPRAAIATGAVDLVLPLHEIGAVLAGLALGAPMPRARREVEAADALFTGNGEIAALLRETDWVRTPLGSVLGWPASIRSALRLMLASPLPMLVLCGPERVQLYNDAYRALLGARHPAALGRPRRACWPERWHLDAPVYERVEGGESVVLDDAPMPIVHHGATKDAWFTLAYGPVHDESGAVVGVIETLVETTRRVLGERRLRALHALHALPGTPAGASGPGDAAARALGALATYTADVPFALVYLLDGARAHRVAVAGVDPVGPMAPPAVELAGGHPGWPLARVVREAKPVLVDDLAARFRDGGAWLAPEPPTSALLLPLRDGAETDVVGIIVLGVSPRLPLDERYREFLTLVGSHVAASVVEARAQQREQARLDALTELDRAKTSFFSNVSHEFRTPLTLLLGPLDDALRRRDVLPVAVASDLELAARNARRLLVLVDTLLDFSRAEAGRLRARLEPVDLARRTSDLAAVFQPAAESAGLRLVVRCAPLPAPVWVDVDMWERIVSNLLSNALKFTFAGEIVVELRALPKHVELTVRDTGEGIPAEELPDVFRRFHRVRATRARSNEGSGIGLALVQELVRLHHGRVRVRSTVGEGTALSVWLPISSRHVPASAPPDAGGPPATVAHVLADAALGWSAVSATAAPEADAAPQTVMAPGARVLVVDDNVDMRQYLRRVLGTHWTVDVAADGESALAMLRRDPPDLVLADVMTAGTDGFALVAAIRRDERLRALPVVLLTVTAGEDGAVDGFVAGADDYVEKPFAPRELAARVGARLELARRRRGSA